MRPLEPGELAAYNTPSSVYPLDDAVPLRINGKRVETPRQALEVERIPMKDVFNAHLKADPYVHRIIQNWHRHYDPTILRWVISTDGWPIRSDAPRRPGGAPSTEEVRLKVELARAKSELQAAGAALRELQERALVGTRDAGTQAPSITLPLVDL